MKNRKQNIAVTAIYLLLAFLSAFELFLIQPLIAKHILPWFGGAASVWTACLLFFQSMLFIGYLYAYIISFAKLSVQVICHVALIILSMVMLGWQIYAWGIPITPPRNLALGALAHHPTIAVIILLTLSVGLPYVLLSSTSPLIQSWFYGKEDDRKKPLYFFYAISNIGSLLALLLYPLLLEPLIGLQQQAITWSFGYIGFAVVCTACSIHVLRTQHRTVESGQKTVVCGGNSSATLTLGITWLCLSSTATIMLIAITNQLCANVSPVPMLWILPLSLYLLAFIICFSSHATNIPTVAALVMLPVTALLLFVMKHDLQLGIVPQLASYIIALFCACMLSLGHLHKLRPSPKDLTFFYLMIALGGATGGLFVGIAAPIIFNDYWELRIGLMISCVIATWTLYNKTWLSAWKIPLIVATLAILATLSHIPTNKALTTIEESRNFYGTLKVIKESHPRGVNVYSLMHGKICHGIQFDRGPFSRLPGTYYGPNSGIGIAMANHPKRQVEIISNNDYSTSNTQSESMHIGALGMGIGIIAAYGKSGDSIRFYEINPEVVRMATNSEHFRYISSCQGDVNIVLGDARLSLEQELNNNITNNFDTLTLDVFNGDSIPVHLLTVEAFKTYLAHLNPQDGVLAIHITNMYLDLIPVVSSIAKHYNLCGYVVRGSGDMRLTSDCLWVLLSRDSNYIPTPPKGVKVTPLEITSNTILWTDNFSNIITIMKKNLFVK